MKNVCPGKECGAVKACSALVKALLHTLAVYDDKWGMSRTEVLLNYTVEDLSWQARISRQNIETAKIYGLVAKS